eukprot:scaffold24758_cov62-Phaeocystis_antarctica.AAC.4
MPRSTTHAHNAPSRRAEPDTTVYAQQPKTHPNAPLPCRPATRLLRTATLSPCDTPAPHRYPIALRHACSIARLSGKTFRNLRPPGVAMSAPQTRTRPRAGWGCGSTRSCRTALSHGSTGRLLAPAKGTHQIDLRASHPASCPVTNTPRFWGGLSVRPA